LYEIPKKNNKERKNKERKKERKKTMRKKRLEKLEAVFCASNILELLLLPNEHSSSLYSSVSRNVH
jgi:hypothetical protein